MLTCSERSETPPFALSRDASSAALIPPHGHLPYVTLSIRLDTVALRRILGAAPACRTAANLTRARRGSRTAAHVAARGAASRFGAEDEPLKLPC